MDPDKLSLDQIERNLRKKNIFLIANVKGTNEIWQEIFWSAV